MLRIGVPARDAGSSPNILLPSSFLSELPAAKHTSAPALHARHRRFSWTAILNQSSMPDAPIAVTLHGHVASTNDALIIIEACLRGNLTHVSRRPRQAEGPVLARSGNIFVYEHRSSGVTTWRDGVPWSAPVQVGNFEMRRQLAAPAGVNGVNGTHNTAGLCRRSLSVTVGGLTHHLVAYFDTESVMSEELRRPSDYPNLANILPRPELLNHGLFTTPVEDDDLHRILRALES